MIEPLPARKSGTAKPVMESERIASLDVLRGVAIFGIFMVNIPFFSMTLTDSIAIGGLADSSQGDQWAWLLVKALFELKFISLFSLLFGVGLVLQMMRLEARGAAFVPVYVRRLLTLALIGLAHGLLIWYGDILFMYAIAGSVLLLFRSLNAKSLLMLAAASFLLGGVIYGGCTAAGTVAEQAQAQRVHAAAEERTEDEIAATQHRTDVDDRWERYRAAMRESGYNPEHPAWGEAERIAYKEGPFLAALEIRAFSFIIGHILVAGVLLGFLPRILGFFLLGAALMKLGFFSPKWSRWHLHLFIIGMLLGLPLEIASALSYPAADWSISGVSLLGEVVHYFSSMALCLGYVGGICLLVHSGRLRPISRALASVGRMALTNYIGQSIVATFVMYWWGLALFGELSRPQQLALVCGIFAGQIVFSVLWLQLFTMGPLEWLWRAATYGRLHALLRTR